MFVSKINIYWGFTFIYSNKFTLSNLVKKDLKTTPLIQLGLYYTWLVLGIKKQHKFRFNSTEVWVL